MSALPGKTRRLLKLYEDDLRVRYGERTAREYLSCARSFLVWLAARGVELPQARTQDLSAYQSALYALRRRDGRPFSSGSQANHLKVVKNLFRFLYRRGYLLSDPAAGLPMPRLEKRLPRVILTREEAVRILEAPPRRTVLGLRDRAILETLYATGIRASELASLAVEDVDTEEGLLRVVLGKGRKDRNVPLTRKGCEAIEAYLLRSRPRLVKARASRHLFLSVYGLPMNRGRLSEIVRESAKEAGVKKHVTCHTFRHSLATHLLRGRADIRHIQRLLGHASLQTTERYTRVEIEDLKEVIRRAHPRGR